MKKVLKYLAIGVGVLFVLGCIVGGSNSNEDELKNEKASLVKECDELKAEKDTLENESVSNEEYNSLVDEYNALQNDSSNKDEKITQLEDRIKKLKEDRELLREKCDKLKNKSKSTSAGKSTKVTLGMKNAVKTAQEYADVGASKQNAKEILVDACGFSEKEAQYGVDKVFG